MLITNPALRYICESAWFHLPHRTSGTSLNDRLIELSPGHILFVSESAILRTGVGRAEVLLGPCAAKWVGDNSSFRVVSSALSDMRIERTSDEGGRMRPNVMREGGERSIGALYRTQFSEGSSM